MQWSWHIIIPLLINSQCLLQVNPLLVNKVMLINFNLTHSFPILSSIEIEGTKYCIGFLIFCNNGGTNRMFKFMTNSLICKLYSFTKMIKTLSIISPFCNFFKFIINNLGSVLVVLLLLQANCHLIFYLLLMAITINQYLFFSFLLTPWLNFKATINHKNILLVLNSRFKLWCL